MQGSKVGCSSLPKLWSEHQIVLRGGPVVYWKLSTIEKQYFDNILKMFTHTFFDQCDIFFINIYVWQGFFQMYCTGEGQLCLIFPKTNLQLAISRPTEIWQDHQISRAGGPMVHCLEM